MYTVLYSYYPICTVYNVLSTHDSSKVAGAACSAVGFYEYCEVQSSSHDPCDPFSFQCAQELEEGSCSNSYDLDTNGYNLPDCNLELSDHF